MNKDLYLIDTCSFVLQIKDAKCASVIDVLIERGQFVLSSIVAMELYAGSWDKNSKLQLDLLSRALDQMGLLVVPTFQDYQQAGILLNNYSRRQGHTAVSPHFRDILISLCALRVNAVVISENYRDFVRWSKEIKRSNKRQLRVQSLLELIN